MKKLCNYLFLYFVGKFIKSLFGKNDHGLDSKFPYYDQVYQKKVQVNKWTLWGKWKKYEKGFDTCIWSYDLKHQ